MFNIILPWPSIILSPNARKHWAVIAKEKKIYRETCYYQAKAQGATQLDCDKINVNFLFSPPSKRRIDLDNCIARIKSGIDGIADAIKIDDSNWKMAFEFSGNTGGFIEVKICSIKN